MVDINDIWDDEEDLAPFMKQKAVAHPARRSTDYTTPAARMAPLAEALMRDPNVMCHALIQALDAIKGRGCRDVIINQLNQEARK